MEDILIKQCEFAIPGRKARLKSDVEYKVLLINTIETLSERPKKTKAILRGKKKWPTLKSQSVVDKKSKQIICIAFSHGKRHDFRLFKD